MPFATSVRLRMVLTFVEVVILLTKRQLCLNPRGLERVESFTSGDQQVAEGPNQTKPYGHRLTPQRSGIVDHRPVTESPASERADREDRHQIMWRITPLKFV
jgi:hypothetical protein